VNRGRHPQWCGSADDRCEHSAELWRHRTGTRTLVTGSGEMLQAWGEQYVAFYSATTAEPSVVLMLIGGKAVRLTGTQARRLGEHLAGLVARVRNVELVAAKPGIEPHPTWCAWAKAADGEACHDSAFVRHHLSEMDELLTNGGELVEVEGGMWTSAWSSSDPLVTLTLDGKGVDLTPPQAAQLARDIAELVEQLSDEQARAA
jgi:hypothetical protein